MKNFEEYINSESIVNYLVRLRAKKAKSRNKKIIIQNLSTHPRFNFHKKQLPIDELQELLPPRRKWKKLTKEQRRNDKGYPLNSVDKNVLILKHTIKYYQKTNPTAPFLLKLKAFVESIQASCHDPLFKFNKPSIIPQLKEKNNPSDKTCRPIADYALRDKIIINLTNKYFTELFDSYFKDNSYAFRAKRSLPSGGSIIPTHHEAFKQIIEYKNHSSGADLYVAECDMQKFYDSVNHTIIKKFFRRLIKKVKRDALAFYSPDAERLFYKYLDSYTFNKDVFALNGGSYFKDRKIIGGKFAWVDKELIEGGLYKSFKNAKIGVPQGGALSGLIANIVLDCVDREVLKKSDPDLFYIRFCDDMVVIHPKYEVALNLVEKYRDVLRKLKLVPHEPKDPKLNCKEFWKMKSKKPYLWGAKEKGGSDWIGFVGYEVHHNGYVRVRQKSLNKEIEKQRETVNKVLSATQGGANRVSKHSIEESVMRTLIGMSVGRIGLWNYRHAPSEFCWANGFQLLNDNKYSRAQLSKLDRSRNFLIKKMRRGIEGLPAVETVSSESRGNKQIVYYGKPFSYYYNALKKVSPAI